MKYDSLFLYSHLIITMFRQFDTVDESNLSEEEILKRNKIKQIRRFTIDYINNNFTTDDILTLRNEHNKRKKDKLTKNLAKEIANVYLNEYGEDMVTEGVGFIVALELYSTYRI